MSRTQNARETLENAIRLVDTHPTWDAHVVYGDTDSLFVQLPGRHAYLATSDSNHSSSSSLAMGDHSRGHGCMDTAISSDVRMAQSMTTNV